MTATGEADPPKLTGIHHVAYRCRDAEQTRWFYEDVLGLKLAAAISFDKVPGTGEEAPYLHVFFELGDGSYIAFFDEPNPAKSDWFERKESFDMHIALEAPSEEALLAWQARINAHGRSCLGPVDHEFVKSVYMYDPNGIQVEITCRTARHDEVMAHEEAGAREEIARWCARTREEKERLFGARSIDRRGRADEVGGR